MHFLIFLVLIAISFNQNISGMPDDENLLDLQVDELIFTLRSKIKEEKIKIGTATQMILDSRSFVREYVQKSLNLQAGKFSEEVREKMTRLSLTAKEQKECIRKYDYMTAMIMQSIESEIYNRIMSKTEDSFTELSALENHGSKLLKELNVLETNALIKCTTDNSLDKRGYELCLENYLKQLKNMDKNEITTYIRNHEEAVRNIPVDEDAFSKLFKFRKPNGEEGSYSELLGHHLSTFSFLVDICIVEVRLNRI